MKQACPETKRLGMGHWYSDGSDYFSYCIFETTFDVVESVLWHCTLLQINSAMVVNPENRAEQSTKSVNLGWRKL